VKLPDSPVQYDDGRRHFRNDMTADRIAYNKRNGGSSSRNGEERSFDMIKTLTITAALLGTTLIALPASAAPMTATSGSALALADSGKALVQDVQYRRYGPRYGYRGGPRYGYRGGYYRGGRGAAIGAGIAAGAIGALAAGALAAQPTYVEPAPVYAAPVYGGYGPADTDAVAYCSRRFRSYDPETGTYIGAGGVVRACP
jgi:hypothetical protein